MNKTFIALAAFGLFAVGCDGPDPTTPMPDGLGVNPSAGPVVAFANGDWTIAGVRVMAFTARLHADGTANGEWERVNQPGVASHGDVVCVNIKVLPSGGRQAWIGTFAESGPFAGLEGGFRVIDNGEGANAVPDQASLQFVNLGPGGAQNYCNTAPASPALLTVGAGNIQIK